MSSAFRTVGIGTFRVLCCPHINEPPGPWGDRWRMRPLGGGMGGADALKERRIMVKAGGWVLGITFAARSFAIVRQPKQFISPDLIIALEIIVVK